MSTVPERLTAALADRYRIERELGRGGMATVYLAEDLKHKRKVAVKVLKPELAAVLGAERFVVEITTTAALQHPHILPLFDSGEADGFLYYVMPFIDGETLRSKLDRETQLGVDESVRIASDVASALHYAHTQGVIHRDIKPENILLHDGRPMVADFGIALAVSAAAGGRMTETGLSLGTPHYMSPEQATAEKEISGRSDIYSLASVLYEMLAGQPPHLGGSAQQIIMKIITEQPAQVTALRKSVPANVTAAIAKALEKLPADRFATAREFAEALANPAFSVAGSAALASGPRTASAPARRTIALLGATAVAFAALALWALTRGRNEPRDVGLPPTVPITLAGAFRTISVSPDGSFIVYIASEGNQSQLWYRHLETGESRPIPGTAGASGTPRISPDGERVVFVSNRELKSTSIAGGAVTSLTPSQDPLGGEWGADGTISYADNDGRVMRWVQLSTGAMREVPVGYCILPQPIEKNRVICGGGAYKYASVIDLDRPSERASLTPTAAAAGPGSPKYLIGSDFRLIDGRYLLYMSIEGSLMATRIENLDSMTFGRSVAMIPGVRRATYTGAGQYDVAANGSLVWVPGINAEIGRLVKRDRTGRLDTLPMPGAAYLRWTPSPDGERIAAVVEGPQSQELHVYPLKGGAPERVDTAFYMGSPGWTPDGRSIAYGRYNGPESETLLLRRLDVPAAPQRLANFTPPGHLQASAFLSDNLLMLGTSTLGQLIVDRSQTPARVDTVAVGAFFASLSPDRKWLAWQPGGEDRIYLQPWPALDRRFLIASSAFEPRWSSPNELWYLTDYNIAGQAANIRRARIDFSGATPIARDEPMVQDPRFNDTPGWSYALTREGEVIYLQAPSENLGYYVRVQPNWVAKMKRAVDEANP